MKPAKNIAKSIGLCRYGNYGRTATFLQRKPTWCV